MYEVGAALNTLAFLVGAAIGTTHAGADPCALSAVHLSSVPSLSDTAQAVATMMLTVISVVLSRPLV